MELSLNNKLNKHTKVVKITKKAISYTFLILLSIFFLFPFFIMVTRSFMTTEEIQFGLPELMFPKSFYLGAYKKLINLKMLYWLKNTIVILVVNVIATPLTASMVAFAFSKLNFSGKKFWFTVMLSTMMLPAITLQIPMYIIYSKLNWTKTILPLTIPAFLGGGVGSIFLIMQFMKGIPNELNNSAMLDGASPLVIYLKIVLPLSFPIVMFFGVNVFIAMWNDFMGPLMYLQKESTYTLALGIYKMFQSLEFKGQQNWNMQMASGVVLFLPCVIIFFIFQKQLIEGVTFSGLKG